MTPDYRRALLLHAPVIHAGYLDFLVRNKDRINGVYLIQDPLIEKLSSIKPDIAAIPANEMRSLLDSLGYGETTIFSEDMVSDLSNKPLLLVNDRVSRSLQEAYFPESDIEWDSVFLRWDADSLRVEDAASFSESHDPFDQGMMSRAYAEAEKSSDWWRRVGAVLVKGSKILDIAHNQGMPSDHTPYQRGAVRDLLAPGVQPEMVDTIHAEQALISHAARRGTSLDGASLYVTHFPCPLCAKLIIGSGIRACFFAEGWSTLASAPLLEAALVSITKVVL